jgi:hypothetical protein
LELFAQNITSCDVAASKILKSSNENLDLELPMDSLFVIKFYQNGKFTNVLNDVDQASIWIQSKSYYGGYYFLYFKDSLVEKGDIGSKELKKLYLDTAGQINKIQILSKSNHQCTWDLDISYNRKQTLNFTKFVLKSIVLDDNVDKKQNAVITQYKSNGLVSPGEKASIIYRFQVISSSKIIEMPSVKINSNYDGVNISNIKSKFVGGELIVEALIKTTLIPVKNVIISAQIEKDTVKCYFNFDKPLFTEESTSVTDREIISESSISRVNNNCEEISLLYSIGNRLFIDQNIMLNAKLNYNLINSTVNVIGTYTGELFLLPLAIYKDSDGFLDFEVLTDSVSLASLINQPIIIKNIDYNLTSSSIFDDVSQFLIGTLMSPTFNYFELRSVPLNIGYSLGNRVGIKISIGANVDNFRNLTQYENARICPEGHLEFNMVPQQSILLPVSNLPLYRILNMDFGVWKRINEHSYFGLNCKYIQFKEYYQYKLINNSESSNVFLIKRNRTRVSPGIFYATNAGKIDFLLEACYSKGLSTLTLYFNL